MSSDTQGNTTPKIIDFDTKYNNFEDKDAFIPEENEKESPASSPKNHDHIKQSEEDNLNNSFKVVEVEEVDDNNILQYDSQERYINNNFENPQTRLFEEYLGAESIPVVGSLSGQTSPQRR